MYHQSNHNNSMDSSIQGLSDNSSSIANLSFENSLLAPTELSYSSIPHNSNDLSAEEQDLPATPITARNCSTFSPCAPSTPINFLTFSPCTPSKNRKKSIEKHTTKAYQDLNLKPDCPAKYSTEQSILTDGSIIKKVKEYFATASSKDKYSKKENNLNVSFRKIAGKIYLISNGRLAQGDYGYIKKITDIDDKQEYVMKISPANTEKDLINWEQQKSILTKLDEYHAFFEASKPEVRLQETTPNEVTMPREVTPKRTQTKLRLPISLKPFTNVTNLKLPDNLEAHVTQSENISFSTIPMPISKSYKEELQATSKWDKKDTDPKGFPKKYAKKIGFVMQLFKGSTLKDYLEKNSLSLLNKLELLLAILTELDKLHQKNIIHNDLHLKNILVSANSKSSPNEFTIMLIDYELAKLLPDNTQVIAETNSIAQKYYEQFSGFELPPELDDPQQGIPLREHELYKDIENIKKILTEYKTQCGFSSKYSDIKTLGESLGGRYSNFIQEEKQLVDLINSMREDNPFARPSLSTLINQCKSLIDKCKDKSVLAEPINYPSKYKS